VFDRLLARVTRVLGKAAMLKGGLVLELRLERARTTRDVDLRLVGSPGMRCRVFRKPEEQTLAIS
jgi:nucleotidyltransferase AbiEii toxin of type IV toxin-antitoxin system